MSLLSTLKSLLLPSPPPMSSPFDPTLPSPPLSFPIKSLSYLRSRAYFSSFHFPFNCASVPLPPDAVAPPPRRRLLVCHDMAGGYLDDRWAQGGTNPDAYGIWHWYLMDVFVYFSHSLVTIPPPCWINAAHRHGVKVLGTFITEWDEGRVVANEFLSSKESARTYAELLAELAEKLGFDGWLINMEVKLDPDKIPNMKEFVSHLTQIMHSSVAGSLVIWYDSVTVDGDLQWQDQLNDKNKPFFDLCDGIFVNYTWKADYPAKSAAVAGTRQYDVYMGIDVFGRGTFGGGQWNVSAALDILKRDNVSAALFAPGWIYETKQPPNFEAAQNEWWSRIEKSWGVVQYYPTKLPFYSNFDQGHGYHFFIEGLKVSDSPWNNISCQQFQPFLSDFTSDSATPFVKPVGECYSGGGKITLTRDLDYNAIVLTRIFEGNLNLGDLPIFISFSVRSNGNSQIGLCLLLANTENDERISILIGADTPSSSFPKNKFDEVISPLKSMSNQGWILHEANVTKSGWTLVDIQVTFYLKGQVDMGNASILENNELVNLNETSDKSERFEASLGHISIRASEESKGCPPACSWSTKCQFMKWTSGPDGSRTLSVKILWELNEVHACIFNNYNIYIEKLIKGNDSDSSNLVGDGGKFIGVANVEAYYVSEYEVPPGTAALRFIIQVCALDGACQKLDSSPSFQLIVEDQ